MTAKRVCMIAQEFSAASRHYISELCGYVCDSTSLVLFFFGFLTSTAPQKLFNVRATSVNESERLTHQAKLLREGHAEHSTRGNGDVCPVC
jgi:hypothetical protein